MKLEVENSVTENTVNDSVNKPSLWQNMQHFAQSLEYVLRDSATL